MHIRSIEKRKPITAGTCLLVGIQCSGRWPAKTWGSRVSLPSSNETRFFNFTWKEQIYCEERLQDMNALHFFRLGDHSSSGKSLMKLLSHCLECNRKKLRGQRWIFFYYYCCSCVLVLRHEIWVFWLHVYIFFATTW